MKKIMPHLFIAALGGLLVWGYMKYQKDVGRLSAKLEMADSSLSISKTNEGYWQTQAKALEVDRDFLISTYEGKIKSLTDNPKIKHVTTVKEVKTVINDTVIVEVPKVVPLVVEDLDKEGTISLDKLVTGKLGEYKDDWIELEVWYDGLFYSFPYTVKDSITIISSTKKKLFKPNELTVSAISHNPNSKVKTLSEMTLKERSKKYGLSVFGGVGLTRSFKFEPVIGIGLTRRLISF